MQNRKRIMAVVNSGSGGDPHPLMAIAMELHKRGHDVRISGDIASQEVFRNTGILVSTRPPEREFEAYVIPWRKKVDEVGRLKAGPGPIREWSADCVPYAEKVVQEFQPDIIIGQLFSVQIADTVSSQSGVP